MNDEGLIGADVFADFPIDLDFPHAKMKLSQLLARPDDAAPSQANSLALRYSMTAMSPRR
jgi:hypothetical protein